jgi:hypothetical protein
MMASSAVYEVYEGSPETSQESSKNEQAKIRSLMDEDLSLNRRLDFRLAYRLAL